MSDLEKYQTSELQRAVGILMCERMLVSRPADVEAKIDVDIDRLNLEIRRRKSKGPLDE